MIKRLSEKTIDRFLTSHTTKNDSVFYSVDENDIPKLLDAQIAECQKDIDKVQIPEGLEKEIQKSICERCFKEVCPCGWPNEFNVACYDGIKQKQSLISLFQKSVLPAVEAAKKAERERIGNWLDNQQRTAEWVYLPLPTIMKLIDGQALKQEE
jgi:hypothetical protein